MRLPTPYYELHITINNNGERQKLKETVEREGWKFSNITDDIVLGEGEKLYATIHVSCDLGIKATRLILDNLTDMLIAAGFPVIRKKIECVVYDEKFAA